MKININNKLGFTLIEVMVVIVVLGILVAMVSVSYTGIQRRSAETAVLNDMNHIAESLDLERVRGNEITSIPDEVSITKDVNVTFIQATETISEPQNIPKYTNLTPVQNGLLFYTVGCTELWEEDRPDAPGLKYGQGRDGSGSVVSYVWGPTMCNVYNHPQLQFNASWGNAGGIFNVPITEQDVLDHIENIPNGDSWHADFQHVVSQFYQTSLDRFKVQGGTFPIEVFWDPWCNAAGLSWCVFREDLPPVDPTVGGGGVEENEEQPIEGEYCVQASHNKHMDIAYYLMPDQEKPSEGICPAF